MYAKYMYPASEIPLRTNDLLASYFIIHPLDPPFVIGSQEILENCELSLRSSLSCVSEISTDIRDDLVDYRGVLLYPV